MTAAAVSLDRADDVADYTLKDSRRFGLLNVRSINATAVDCLYEELRVKNGVQLRSERLPFDNGLLPLISQANFPN